MRLRNAALVAAGVGMVATGGIGAALSAASADTFTSVALTASATGLFYMEDEPSAQSHPEVDGEIPNAYAALGDSGYALSSIAWPGALAGNAGTLAVVAGAPPQATQLNDPVRAESRSGGQQQANYTGIPGVTMTSSANDSKAEALASMPETDVPGGLTVGAVSSHTLLQVSPDGSTIDGSALTKISDIDIGGGAVHSESVTSQVNTNGKTAGGGTTVVGMTVANVPVTVDQNGLSIAGNGDPLNQQVDSAVNQVLTNFGMQFAMSGAQKVQKGATLSYTAGSLVIYWKPPNNPHNNVFSVSLGGANVGITSVGYGGNLQVPSSVASLPAAPLPPAAPPAAGAPVTGSAPASSSGNATSNAPTPIVAARAAAPMQLPGGVGAGWVAVGLIGAVVLGTGLWRAPIASLATATTVCPLGEGPP